MVRKESDGGDESGCGRRHLGGTRSRGGAALVYGVRIPSPASASGVPVRSPPRPPASSSSLTACGLGLGPRRHPPPSAPPTQARDGRHRHDGTRGSTRSVPSSHHDEVNGQLNPPISSRDVSREFTVASYAFLVARLGN
uniref:Uncharacterized protein n=1 Tax=Setaria viridis TaxID=4556 RepID=A0A4V6DCK6_SETVI|nr:LOW QUALITY PROTEIN: hypothetical protein SEVIR_1G093800v2 [Setaria viridis]